MEDKKEKLYNSLKKQGLYTKSYEEFSSQFSDEKSQAKLYGALSEKKLYTKSVEDFRSQFFSPPKEEAPKKVSAVSTGSQSDSAQKAGGSDLRFDSTQPIEKETNIKVADNTNISQPQIKQRESLIKKWFSYLMTIRLRVRLQ
jgi:hypothetical protein